MQCTERQHILYADRRSLALAAGRDRGAVGPRVHSTGPQMTRGTVAACPPIQVP